MKGRVKFPVGPWQMQGAGWLWAVVGGLLVALLLLLCCCIGVTSWVLP